MIIVEIRNVKQIEIEENSYEVLQNTGNKGDGGPVYGWVPCKKTKTVDHVVFLQHFDEEIDLKSIIKAINGI